MFNSELESRRDLFRNTLSPDLNAKYYQKQDINNTIISEFALSNIKTISNGNILVGKFEDYDYCLFEYYVKKRFSEELDCNLSAVIRMHERNFPEFGLVQRWEGIILDLLICILSFPFLLVFIFSLLFLVGTIATAFIHTEEMFEEIDKSVFIKSVIKRIFNLSILFIPSYFFFKSKNKIKERLFQGKYKINNSEFKSRYAFIDVKDVNSINRVFTPKVCQQIVEFIPQIKAINSKNNCLYFNSIGTITDTDSCEFFLSYIVGQAKIFSNKHN